MVDFSLKTSNYKGFSMATLNNQMILISVGASTWHVFFFNAPTFGRRIE